jgi:hypothetical protein
MDDEEIDSDARAAYRYLRDRELVIGTLDDGAFDSSIHNAVSAEDVAIDLGWRRKDGLADSARADRALDALCKSRRVVCFTQPWIRAGEHREMRLFCTPQHLALLAERLDRDRPAITVVADISAASATAVAELLAALDELHRAHGGGGLRILRSHTQSEVTAGATV